MDLKIKFKIKHKVFFMNENKIEEREIDAISIHVNAEWENMEYKITRIEEYFFSNGYDIKAPIEKKSIGNSIIKKYAYQIFSTKEELLKSL